MRNAQFWNKLIRIAYKRVGGLHFFAIGRITISISVSKSIETRMNEIRNSVLECV